MAGAKTNSSNLDKESYYFLTDKRLIIRSWTPQMESLTGRKCDEILGRGLRRVFPHLVDPARFVLRTGRTKRIKGFVYGCMVGVMMEGHVRLSPFRDGSIIRGVSISFGDVKAFCPLSKRLEESERMIAIGKMASSLAHGVRNPLNAIKGAMVYLRDHAGKSKVIEEFSEIINEEIERLDRFISGFLSASDREFHFVKININKLLDSIIMMMGPMIEVNNITVTKKFENLPEVSADEFHLRKAVENIITNAIEAMSNGGDLRIHTCRKKENGQEYVVIEISDTGSGIPYERIRHLGEIEKERAEKGRGFGLFITREIIKSHDGRLIWENLGKRGAIFKIMLPVRDL